MGEQIKVDIGQLDSLDGALSQALTSLSALKGEVKGYMDSAMRQAEQALARLEQLEAVARQKYEVAQAAYCSCRDHQRYDEESGAYRPSCSCEESRMDHAKYEYEKAADKRRTGEEYFKSIKYECEDYMSSPNGGKLFDLLTGDKIPQAQARLGQFREKVDAHEAMQAGLSSSSLGAGQSATANMFDGGTGSAVGDQVKSFRAGMARIKERQAQAMMRAIKAGGDQRERER